MFSVIFWVGLLCSGVANAAADDLNHQQAPNISAGLLQKMGCVSQQGAPVIGNCAVAAAVDLTAPFHLQHPSSFVVTQPPTPDDPGDEQGLNFCFVENGRPHCSTVSANLFCSKEDNGDGSNCDSVAKTLFGGPVNKLDGVTLINPTPSARYPLLVATAGFDFGRGAPPVEEVIWTFDTTKQSFRCIWFASINGGRNEDDRLITHGPLAGDLIVAVNDPTHHWPWPYGIAVYHLTNSLHYVKILGFIGKSAQAGGPPGAVIDADMPEILRRLHLPAHSPY
jgi:hypothetical protein